MVHMLKNKVSFFNRYLPHSRPLSRRPVRTLLQKKENRREKKKQRKERNRNEYIKKEKEADLMCRDPLTILTGGARVRLRNNMPVFWSFRGVLDSGI